MTDTCEEMWLPVNGFEGHYLVSSLGRLRKVSTGTLVNSHTNSQGYQQVHLHRPKPERPKTLKLHRIVAIAFIPNPENKAEVNHIDLNPKNNAASNLEWATKRENVDHALANGHYDPTKHPNRLKKLTVEQVAEIRAAKGAKSTKELSELYGVGRSQISRIWSGRSFKSTSPVEYAPRPRQPRRTRVLVRPLIMNPTSVLALRAMHASGATPRECAAAFGVKLQQAVRIIKRRAWTHVVESSAPTTQGET